MLIVDEDLSCRMVVVGMVVMASIEIVTYSVQLTTLIGL